ncbi:T9SS type A sorting domain-containing protein [Psychroserpens ponticola]|uniref:T9SS type A sorting domain-containing protein n=1 Tax=Psychroserpens ponticola TaxID=2932268 RepID=A0ABY7S0D9_9FLAO|nr:T9SS type A sorting domain-containing protein [Psychroserpens ponticola]WCO02763.1 T9SS type A sorting domain-containing protein [Psychroserpens ponticola]
MMKNYLLILFSLTAFLSFSQTTYNGNGNTGFGGVIGPGSITINDDGTTITLEVTRGSGEFNDALVIYLDTSTGGRTSIDADVNDQGDDLRRAISSAGDNASVLSFPAGFEPDYAMAIDTNFGGLWSIPETGMIGDNGLVYQTSLNSTLTAASDMTFTLDVDWTELGLTSIDSFKFIGIYLNAGNGYTSDEAFGSSIAGGNVAGNDLTFTSNFEYSNTLSVSQFDTKNNIKVANNILFINNYIGDLNISVVDITGKKIKTLTAYSDSNTLKMPLGLPKNQLYVMHIEGSNFNKTMKIVIR